MAKIKGELGPLERAVMEELWAAPRELTVRQVAESSIGEGYAYTTFETVLDRLWRKRFVSRRKVGRAFAYRTRFTRDQYIAQLVNEVLDRSGDRSGALLGFVRSTDAKDLRQLRAMIEKVDRERRRTR